MRVVFMGTPAFAAASLERLIQDGFEICAVYTQPDKPRGRGMELAFSEVKQLSLQHDLPVFQPATLRRPEETERMLAFHADIIAVVAYGKLLPDEIIHSARFGAVNLHGSLLPKYRGAAPIQWAVINGDSETGLTTFYLNKDMDAGDLIYTETVSIGRTETSGDLYDRMKIIGAGLLSRTLTDIERGTAPRIPQNHAEATYVKPLDKSMSPIDWNLSSDQIISRIYGLQPWPVATMQLQGETVKVFSAEATGHTCDAAPGRILSADRYGIEIACGDQNTLLVTELQVPGKRRMSSADYLRGHPIR